VIPHPLTGELIDEDDLAALLEAATVIDRRIGRIYSREISPLRDARDALLARIADISPAYLPEPRYRTLTQERVARCPRCRTVIPSGKPDKFRSRPG
jgi:hypothetical protein